MVAKNHVHLRAVMFIAVNVIELPRSAGLQDPFAMPIEIRAYRPSQHALVGCHPADTQLVRDSDGLIGDAALGWPDSPRAQSKDALVQLHPAPQLFSGIFRMG